MKYRLASLFIGAVYWMFESLMDSFVFDRQDFSLFPQNLNEAWMRASLILTLLGFGYYVDISHRKVLRQERDAVKLYKSTIDGVNHIVNNFLNHMLYFQFIAKESSDIPDEVSIELESDIQKTSKQLRALCDLSEISVENIEEIAFNRSGRELGAESGASSEPTVTSDSEPTVTSDSEPTVTSDSEIKVAY